jgi:hypothetical protein
MIITITAGQSVQWTRVENKKKTCIDGFIKQIILYFCIVFSLSGKVIIFEI